MTDRIDWSGIDPRQNPCRTRKKWNAYVKRCRILWLLDRSEPGGMLIYDGEQYHVRVVDVSATQVRMAYADLKTGDAYEAIITWTGRIKRTRAKLDS